MANGLNLKKNDFVYQYEKCKICNRLNQLNYDYMDGRSYECMYNGNCVRHDGFNNLVNS